LWQCGRRSRRDSAQNDLIKARPDQIVDLSHPLARLAATIDWGSSRSSSARSIPTSPDSGRCRQGSWRAVDPQAHTICPTRVSAAGSSTRTSSSSVMGWTAPAPAPCWRCRAYQQRNQICPPSQSLGWISRRTCFRFMAPRPTAPLCSGGR